MAKEKSMLQSSATVKAVLISSLAGGKKEILTADGNGNAKTAKYSTRELNKKYMDTSFSGVPAQCDEKTCALMKKEIDFAETQGLEASFRYKYLMDVDGNGYVP